MVVLGPLGRDTTVGQCLMLPVTGAGIAVRNNKVIHGWWLPLLSLGAHGREQAAYQVWFPPVISLEQGIKILKASQDLPLSVGCLSGLVTERACEFIANS